MSFALIIIGITLIVAAVKDTQHCLFETVKQDFESVPGKTGNFTYWVVALLIFGAIGYSETWRPVSEAMLVLIIVALFLSQGSGTAQGITFFNNLLQSLKSSAPAAQTQ